MEENIQIIIDKISSLDIFNIEDMQKLCNFCEKWEEFCTMPKPKFAIIDLKDFGFKQDLYIANTIWNRQNMITAREFVEFVIGTVQASYWGSREKVVAFFNQVWEE